MHGAWFIFMPDVKKTCTIACWMFTNCYMSSDSANPKRQFLHTCTAVIMCKGLLRKGLLGTVVQGFRVVHIMFKLQEILLRSPKKLWHGTFTGLGLQEPSKKVR